MTSKTTVPKRKAKPDARTSSDTPIKPTSKLDQLEQMLRQPDGATIAQMMELTGWQQHSVRGVIAGSLKKRGLRIASEKVDGVRRYRVDSKA